MFVLCLAATLVLGGLWFRRPGPAAAADRLDQEDTRRPLATLRDDLAVGRGTQDSETVWRAHRDRAREAAVALKARWPDLRLSSRDKLALRLVAPALLIGGLIASGGTWPERIASVADPAPMSPAAVVRIKRFG